MEGGNEITEEAKENVNQKKRKIFVAGATGSTGKNIVEQLLAKGFEVKAGVRDLAKARATFSKHGPSLQMVCTPSLNLDSWHTLKFELGSFLFSFFFLF